MKRYSTILFDSDNTLLDFSGAEQKAFAGLFERLGFSGAEAALPLYRRINREVWEAFERGEMSKSEITALRFSRLFAALGLTADGAAANAVYLDLLSRRGENLPGAFELCTALKAAGYDLCLITNGVQRVQRGRLASNPILPLLSGVFISEEVGVGKPDPRYFDYVFAHIAERDRRRVLAVGDSLSSDMRGAANAGIDRCWYNPEGRQNDTDIALNYTVKDFGELSALLI